MSATNVVLFLDDVAEETMIIPGLVTRLKNEFDVRIVAFQYRVIGVFAIDARVLLKPPFARGHFEGARLHGRQEIMFRDIRVDRKIAAFNIRVN